MQKKQEIKLNEKKKRKPPRYTLGELLARCNSKTQRRQQEREWLAGKPVCRELI